MPPPAPVTTPRGFCDGVAINILPVREGSVAPALHGLGRRRLAVCLRAILEYAN